MKILGIIAEYDPFHRGHALHLQKARDEVKPDFTYVVLSGCFRQRGEPAMFSPYDRAECALAAGADAVFALPVRWTIRDAEHYALGAVSLLKDLGATCLAFGAETPRAGLLQAAAERLERPSAELRETLKRNLAEGDGYPRALSRALEVADVQAAGILDRPNNILAVCYLRAILRLGADLRPVVIPRTGDYRMEEISAENPSASSLRQGLLRGEYARVRDAVTPACAGMIREAFLAGRAVRPERFDPILIHLLRGMNREEAAALPDVSEGLEDRLLKAAGTAGTREKLLDGACSRRYPRARISRICACAAAGIRAGDPRNLCLPDRAVLLGLRKNPEMTALWQERKGLITTDFEDPADLRAWRIWAQCAGLPDTLPHTERIRTVSPRETP